MITESVIFFFDEDAGLLFLPIPLYLFRFLILPSVINFAAVGVGYLVLKSRKLDSLKKDYIVCVICFVVCACVELTHYVFAPVLCVPAIAVYISGMFGEVKITRFITILSTISLGLAAVLSSVELRRGDTKLYLDVSIALVITLCSYAVGNLVIKREKERFFTLTESLKRQSEMSEQLNRDILTGLYNRKAMVERLQRDLNRKKLLHLAVLDIDDFKRVNDSYGHFKGDEVLVFLGDLFSRCMGGSGYAVRYGGEEFILVFVDVTKENVFGILEHIQKQLLEHGFVLGEDGKTTYITLSCGVARQEKGQALGDLLKQADKAMYKAKKNGKNNIVYVENSKAKE